MMNLHKNLCTLLYIYSKLLRAKLLTFWLGVDGSHGGVVGSPNGHIRGGRASFAVFYLISVLPDTDPEGVPS